MTVDELIELAVMLADGLTIEGIVTGRHADVLAAVPDHQVALLVRFLGGERPLTEAQGRELVHRAAVDSPPRQWKPEPRLGQRIPDPELEALLDEEEELARQAARNVLERRDDGGHMVLGGEFAGVELP